MQEPDRGKGSLCAAWKCPKLWLATDCLRRCLQATQICLMSSALCLDKIGAMGLCQEQGQLGVQHLSPNAQWIECPGWASLGGHDQRSTGDADLPIKQSKGINQVDVDQDPRVDWYGQGRETTSSRCLFLFDHQLCPKARYEINSISAPWKELGGYLRWGM